MGQSKKQRMLKESMAREEELLIELEELRIERAGLLCPFEFSDLITKTETVKVDGKPDEVVTLVARVVSIENHHVDGFRCYAKLMNLGTGMFGRVDKHIQDIENWTLQSPVVGND